MISASRARTASLKNKEVIKRILIDNIYSSTENAINEAIRRGEFECPLSIWSEETKCINAIAKGKIDELIIDCVREKFMALGYEFEEGFVYYCLRW